MLSLYERIHSKITGIIIVLDINSNTAVVSLSFKKGWYWFIITVQPNPKITAILKEIATTFRSDNDNIQLAIFAISFSLDNMIHIKSHTIETTSPYANNTVIRKISNATAMGTPNRKRQQKIVCCLMLYSIKDTVKVFVEHLPLTCFFNLSNIKEAFWLPETL